MHEDKHPMKYLGIDYGTKRIGLATSDGGGSMAFSHGVVKAGSQHFRLDEVIKKKGEKRLSLASRNLKMRANAV